MFVLDDLITRMLGLDIRPFDLIWIMEVLRDRAYRVKYDLKKIQNQIKENRMLYEFGEIGREEFESRRKELMGRLSTAKQVRKMYGRANQNSIDLV